MIVRYSFHVRRKTGEAETELAFHTGEMPKEGKMVTVVLHDKTVKARVGARTFQRSKEGSEYSLIEVHADEVT